MSEKHDAVQVRVESNKAMDLLVMENVFYERSLAPVYDLKGSERARWCKDDPSDPTTVLLDENLKRDILSAPLLVGSQPGTRPKYAVIVVRQMTIMA